MYHPGSPQDEDSPLSWSVEYPEDVGGGCSCTPMANYCRLPDNTTCYDVQLTVRMRRISSPARLVPESCRCLGEAIKELTFASNVVDYTRAPSQITKVA